MQNRMSRGPKVLLSIVFNWIASFTKHNTLIIAFVTVHTFLAIFLGTLIALAPDEGGYLSTFNNVYKLPISTGAQTFGGWITAPTVFLWLALLPAKIVNVLGVPDYLSTRFLSIFLAAISLYLLQGIQRRGKDGRKLSQKLIFLTFFIPSIFLWTSLGLREAFIIAELTVFLVGLNFTMQGLNKRGMLFLFLGSYGLVSTKNYLWACLMVALILSSIFFLVLGINRRQVVKCVIAGSVLPLAVFASTTSAYALNYIFHSNISDTGARSGDSISQIYVDSPDNTGGNSDNTGGNSDNTGGNSDNTGSTGTKPNKELITFHGDYTLIALHFYLVDNPNTLFSKISRLIHLDKKIQSIWDEKVQAGLISETNQVGRDTSSLNGHILEAGKITDSLSMLWSAFIFLCGPFPFIGDPGIAVGLASLESPLWWAFYALVIFQFIRFRKVKFLKDPQILFTLIFLAGEIAFSALVEVNLGTSFRHRSILLVPLVFLYVRLAQRAKEQKNLELGII